METKTALLELRKRLGLSQEEIAERLFLTRQAVSRWENGETTPSIDTLKMISKTFDVSISSLLGVDSNRLCMFKQDDFNFSYRVAGVLIRDGMVLLQRPDNTDEYAFPGGVVRFGETAAEALIRRWKQETGIEINVGGLKWVEEALFLLDNKPCQQVSLNYIITLNDDDILVDGHRMLTYNEDDENAVRLYWIPLGDVGVLKVYPENTAELLLQEDAPPKHITRFEDI